MAPTPAQAEIAPGGVFYEGLIGMGYLWDGVVTYLKRPGIKVKNWDCSPTPGQARGGVTDFGGCCYVISDGAKQPEAAWEFIKFMVSEDVAKPVAQGGVAPTPRKSLAHYNTPEDGIPEHFYETYVKMVFEHGVPRPTMPGWLEFQTIVRTETELTWLGTESAADALARAVPQVNKVLEKYNDCIQDWMPHFKKIMEAIK